MVESYLSTGATERHLGSWDARWGRRGSARHTTLVCALHDDRRRCVFVSLQATEACSGAPTHTTVGAFRGGQNGVQGD